MVSIIGRRIPSLLREKSFRTYWIGQGASLLGDQIRALALSLTAVLVLHASAGVMGVLTASLALPGLLFSVPAGAWVDRRGERRRTMILADAFRVLLLVFVPLSLWRGFLSLPVLFGVAFLMGVMSLLFRVSAGTLFVSLVPRESYVEAHALLTGSRSLAFLVGPWLGGVLVQLVTAPVALLADALSFAVSAISLSRIRPDEPTAVTPEPRHMWGGLGFIRSSPVLRASLAVAGTMGFFQSVFGALYVLYVTRSLHVTPGELGLILGPGSVGAAATSIWTGRLIRRTGLGPTLGVATLLYTAPLLLVPFAGGTHSVIVGILFLAECLMGSGSMMFAITDGTVHAAAIPDELRARVSAAFVAVSSGLRPLGALLGGVAGTALGVRATLWCAAIGATLTFLWLLPSPLIRVGGVDDLTPSRSVSPEPH